MTAEYGLKKEQHFGRRGNIKGYVERHKNVEMYNMLVCLEPYLDTATGRFGYAVARNVRKLREACTEFIQIRTDLINELGEEEKNEKGFPTGVVRIAVGSEEYKTYVRRIDEYLEISHDVEIYKVGYSELPETMTAGDMIAIEWMLIEDEAPGNSKGEE